jgi:hypothetical protein
MEEKFEIPFTQYLLPDGRKSRTTMETNREVYAKAQRILSAGLVFEIEVLRTGDVSATIVDPIEEIDVDITVGRNDHTLADNISEMIMRFKVPEKDVH